MLIPFDTMPDTVLERFKDGQGTFVPKMYSHPQGKLMLGRLLPHSSIGLHTHQGNSEAVFILSGSGRVLYRGEEIPLQPGDCHYCPMGCEHSLINDSDEELTFWAVVSEHAAGV